jgi:type II secretory ATPase GspE/PulE/Tfp pilus assembly ATPase PilB-like protein
MGQGERPAPVRRPAAWTAAIKKNVSVEDLRDLAMQEGLRTLKMDGILKVFQGVTDLQQILKVCIL